jgi:hypothetical protein
MKLGGQYRRRVKRIAHGPRLRLFPKPNKSGTPGVWHKGKVQETAQWIPNYPLPESNQEPSLQVRRAIRVKDS